MRTLAVHDGSFHPDDVFAVAILKLVYPKIKIIRTRDQKRFNKTDVRVDVGRKYNFKKKDFDHHQKEFTEKRKNGIPYASAGLVWKHFGNLLVSSREAFSYIDTRLIQSIDAHDNGITPYETVLVKPYAINEVINTFIPDWKDRDPDYNLAFNKALNFAIDLLKKEIKIANSIKEAKKLIKKLVKQTSKEYIVFDHEPPIWKEIIIDYPKIKFAIYKSPNNKWNAEATRVKTGSFDVRKPFPESWADLTDEKLAKITGVNDAVFCHKQRFIVVTKSKEGVLMLVEKALNL